MTAVIEDEDFVIVKTGDERLKVVIADVGLQGADGTDGLSAYEVAVLEGFVGTELQWLDSLVGPPGADGQDGADGNPGPPGAPGGIIGSASAPLSINVDSVLLLEYDATTLSVGPDGLTVIGGVGGGGDAETLDGFDSTYFIDTSVSTQTKAGDLTIAGQTTTDSVDLSSAQLNSDSFTINSTLPLLIDSFFAVTYRSAEYTFQFTQGTSHALVRLMLIHDGTNVAVSEYGHVEIGTEIDYLFDATYSLGSLELTVECPGANVTPVGLKFSRTLFDA